MVCAGQALMPDALHWIGVKRIHRLVSMSDMKYDAITASVRTGFCVCVPALACGGLQCVCVCVCVCAGH